MTLTLNETAGRFSRLPLQCLLLLSNPVELGNGVGPGDLQPGCFGGYQRHPPVRRMDGKVYVFDVLPEHLNR